MLTRVCLRVKLTCYERPGQDDSDWNTAPHDYLPGGNGRQSC